MQIFDLQYFPNIDYLRTLFTADKPVFENFDQYRKMTFKNRCIVAGANGLINLSVPLLSGREQRTLITAVEIDYSSSWNKQHWKTIVSCYHRAPYFEYYSDSVHELLFSEEKLLADLNMRILRWLFKILKPGTVPGFTESYQAEYTTEHVDYRTHWLPRNYQQQGSNIPEYSQVFSDRFGFQRNLSILDLIFCMGPQSVALLHGQN